MALKRLLAPAALFMLVFCLMAVPTRAYLDPGSVNVIWQVLAGVVIMGGAAIAIFWKKLRLAFKKKKPEQPADASTVNAAADAALTDTDQGTIRIERRTEAPAGDGEKDDAPPTP